MPPPLWLPVSEGPPVIVIPGNGFFPGIVLASLLAVGGSFLLVSLLALSSAASALFTAKDGTAREESGFASGEIENRPLASPGGIGAEGSVSAGIGESVSRLRAPIVPLATELGFGASTSKCRSSSRGGSTGLSGASMSTTRAIWGIPAGIAI